jgi:hypothetical protein
MSNYWDDYLARRPWTLGGIERLSLIVRSLSSDVRPIRSATCRRESETRLNDHKGPDPSERESPATRLPKPCPSLRKEEHQMGMPVPIRVTKVLVP